MKKNNPLMQPLSEKELNWLGDYLDDIAETYNITLSLEKIDGVLCALIINPILLKPLEWLGVIFDESFDFKSEQDEEKIINLLIRHWNHISHLIRHPSKTEDDLYFPLVASSDENNRTYKLAEQWATGFHIGMDYCDNEWDALISDNENYTLLAPVLLLELGYNPDHKERVVTDEIREHLVAMIPDVVYKIFDYWQAKTKKSKESNIKIGRNDPCPCGSGKKYKKCCAGTVSETIH